MGQTDSIAVFTVLILMCVGILIIASKVKVLEEEHEKLKKANK